MTQAPFSIYIEGRDSNLSNMHAMAIARKLHEAGIDHTEAIRRGPNRIQLTFDNPNSANSVVDGEKKVPDDWVAYIPDEKVFAIGVVQKIDTELDPTVILNSINCRFPNSKFERFHKRVSDESEGISKLVPTQSLKIFFSSDTLPDDIKINKFRCNVKPYVQMVLQCSKCWRYGHPRMYCRSKCDICAHCGTAHAYNKDSCEKILLDA